MAKSRRANVLLSGNLMGRTRHVRIIQQVSQQGLVNSRSFTSFICLFPCGKIIFWEVGVAFQSLLVNFALVTKPFPQKDQHRRGCRILSRLPYFHHCLSCHLFSAGTPGKLISSTGDTKENLLTQIELERP